MKIPLPSEMQVEPGEYIVRLGAQGQYPYIAQVGNGDVYLEGLTEDDYETLGRPRPVEWRWPAKPAGSAV